MPPIYTHDCNCLPVKSSVEQRGAQTEYTQADCQPKEKLATALNSRLAAGRANAASTARYTATEFPSRGREASL